VVPAEKSPRQISPDGKWYWDGQNWVPMPTAPPSRPRRKIGLGGVLIIVAALLLLGFFWAPFVINWINLLVR
jgi:hypothetical protein